MNECQEARFREDRAKADGEAKDRMMNESKGRASSYMEDGILFWFGGPIAGRICFISFETRSWRSLAAAMFMPLCTHARHDGCSCISLNYDKLERYETHGPSSHIVRVLLRCSSDGGVDGHEDGASRASAECSRVFQNRLEYIYILPHLCSIPDRLDCHRFLSSPHV
jgi:hypothetical protein